MCEKLRLWILAFDQTEGAGYRSSLSLTMTNVFKIFPLVTYDDRFNATMSSDEIYPRTKFNSGTGRGRQLCDDYAICAVVAMRGLLFA